MEKVSAIITTHNRAKLLKRAIDSVAGQTYGNIELIIVDDASTDGTEELCRGLANVNYIRVGEGESRGGNHARNLGILAAKGKYVAFLDDDDCWKPDKIEKQVRLMEEKKCGVVFCGQKLEIMEVGSVRYADLLPAEANQGDVSKKILYNIVSVTSCMLFDKKALMEAGMFDENLNFWQEYELTIRLAQLTRFYFVAEPLVVYRIDTGDKQRKTNKYHEWRKAVKYVLKKHKKLFATLNKAEKARLRMLINTDARQRCKANGMWFRSYTLHLEWIFLRKYLKLFSWLNN